MQDTVHTYNRHGQRYGIVSSPGGRDYNEDACAVRDYSQRRKTQYLCLMVMADGMGGHNAGDVASQVAVQMLERLAGPRQFEGGKSGFSDAVERVIWNAFSAINSHIHDLGESSQERRGMGTTLTCGLVDNSFVYVGHVGDSRAYIISADDIRQLTEDHSVVGKMVSEGILSESQAQTHEKRNVLTRAIGPEPNVEIDLLKAPIKPGETVFMCSDGLHTVVRASEVYQMVHAEGDLQAACERLVQLSMARGADDNVSAIAWKMPLIETHASAVTRLESEGTRRAAGGLSWWIVTLLALAALGIGILAGWGMGVALHLGDQTGRVAKPEQTAPKANTTPAMSDPFPYGATLEVSLEDPAGTCRLRQEPSTEGTIITTLSNGCLLEVISSEPSVDSAGYTWYQVKVSEQGQSLGTTGYVRSDYLKETQQRMEPQ